MLESLTARDQRDGHPQVDWACPAGNKPKYTITFCPIGSAKIGSKNVGEPLSPFGVLDNALSPR